MSPYRSYAFDNLIDGFSIVPGLMEHEAIPNISTSRRIGGKSGGGAKPHSSRKHMIVTVDVIIKEVSIAWSMLIVCMCMRVYLQLSTVLSILQANYLDPSVIGQLFKQVCALFFFKSLCVFGIFRYFT